MSRNLSDGRARRTGWGGQTAIFRRKPEAQQPGQRDGDPASEAERVRDTGLDFPSSPEKDPPIPGGYSGG